MGIIDKLIRKSPSSLSSDGKNAVFAHAADNEIFNATETEIAMKKTLAFFHEAIHDEDQEAIDFDKIMRRVVVPKVNPQTGEIEYARDSMGAVCKDGTGAPIPVFIEGRQVDNYAAALAVLESPLNRLSFINPKNVALYSLYAENIVADIIMNSSSEDFENGKITYLNSKLVKYYKLLDDATNGRKITALLTVRKEASQDINVRQQSKDVSARWF
ncbi:MAG: hypothetical protein LBC12_01815 [Nitrososphaerota archaeon]|jgi:hypothetical protein|nr:hypothetical protein [Nitrososphaerota archaeon]